MHPFDGKKQQVIVECVVFEYEEAYQDYCSEDGFIDVYLSPHRGVITAIDYGVPGKPTFDLSDESDWLAFRAHLRSKQADDHNGVGATLLHDRWGTWRGDPEHKAEGW